MVGCRCVPVRRVRGLRVGRRTRTLWRTPWHDMWWYAVTSDGWPKRTCNPCVKVEKTRLVLGIFGAGGGSYGIVTAFRWKTVPCRPFARAVVFRLNGQLLGVVSYLKNGNILRSGAGTFCLGSRFIHALGRKAFSGTVRVIAWKVLRNVCVDLSMPRSSTHHNAARGISHTYGMLWMCMPISVRKVGVPHRGRYRAPNLRKAMFN